MTTALKTSSASNALAALGGLKAGLSNVQASIPVAGGEPILRMGRDGIWVYGAENTEVEDGSEWAVNPLSLKHGWICWKKRPEGSKEKAEKYGEVLVPMREPKPTFNALPTYEDGEWSEQTSITLRCLNGTDEGAQTDYKPSSIGGSNAMKDLIAAIMKQLDTDPDHPVPVILLKSDHYNNKTWGKTYVPILEIIDWMDMDGLGADDEGEDAGTEEAKTEPVEEPKQEASAATTGRRRAAPATTKTEEPPFEADAPKETAQTQAAAQGQGEVRRRRR